MDEILSRLYHHDHVLLDNLAELQRDCESYDHNDRTCHYMGSYHSYVCEHEYCFCQCRVAIARFAQMAYAMRRVGKIPDSTWNVVSLTMDEHLLVLRQLEEYNFNFHWLLDTIN